MIDVLLALLRPTLLAVEGGSRNPLHWLAALIALPLDVIIAHTSWAAMYGWPRRGEWTISKTLERLCVTPSERQRLFVEIAREINRISPTGRHIKAIAPP